MADLDAASLEDARGFYATWYAPDNAVLSIVGDVETPEAVALAERYFGGIPAKGSFPTPPSTAIAPRLGGEVRRTVPDRVPVPRVFVGYRTAPFGTPEFDAMQVAATRARWRSRQPALQGACARPPAAAAVGRADHRQLAVHRRRDADDRRPARPARASTSACSRRPITTRSPGSLEGVTAEEVERAKALITSQWLHHLSSVEGRADTFSQYATLLGDPGLINEALPSWLAVTAVGHRGRGRARC